MRDKNLVSYIQSMFGYGLTGAKIQKNASFCFGLQLTALKVNSSAHVDPYLEDKSFIMHLFFEFCYK